MKEHVLIVDDDPAFRRVWSKLLTAAGYVALEAGDGEAALKHDARLVILDLMLPPTQRPEEGAKILEQMLAKKPDTKVIVASGSSELALSLELVKRGAYDFIAKPVEPDVLLAVLERAHARLTLEDRVHELERSTTAVNDGLIGDSPAFLDAKRLAERAAPADVPVLLLGESGTGKELFARFVHTKSRRSNKAFIPINCGALSPNLLESQLFGHKKGSFTGAINDSKGLFVEADGGTLFLDEVGDLPADLQVKLLRVLECGEVLPVGATQPRTVDVRIVSATNKPLAKMIADGTFREDLFWRLKGIEVQLPRLQERIGDVIVLAQHFLNAAKSIVPGPTPRLSAAAQRAIETYAWPGNLRELRHEMQRALVMSAGRTEIAPEDLSASLRPKPSEEPEGTTLEDKIAALERSELRAALEATGGNRSHAAERLGLSRQGLLNKLSRYGLK